MSVGFIRFAKAANLVTAVCLFAFGITVIVMPSLDISVIRIVSEALLILFGIFKMAGYFSKELYRLAFQYDLPLGILFIIIGTVMLIRSWLETDIICTLFGSALIIDSIFKVIISKDAKKFGLRSWALLLILALLVCVAGILLLFRPTESERLWLVIFGSACILDGVLNFSEKIFMVKVVKNQKKEESDEIKVQE